ncbi:MAG: hypothetical protein AA908_01735 [Chlorobi bacterium NICIL-2]|nr:MAG: hypothetical protein AA908_01735 [Chlorobi bacterium NICIL-2]GBD04622.1 hypothetical protein HRbin20_00188 [bacterium HR20]GIV56098.1 MAG: hypothetical protein KatS3mg040_0866 [Candidatus Kapabacteria bacterium]
MNASLFRAAAIACCGLLWSCGVYVPIQEPKTLAPGETSLMAGAHFNRLFGYDISRESDALSGFYQTLQKIYPTFYTSGRLGIAPGWDIGATLGYPYLVSGFDIKHRIAKDSLYSSALSVGVNYIRSPYVEEGGFLNLTWSAGSKHLIFQTQCRLLAGDQIPPRYGLNAAIALRLPQRDRGTTTYFGLNGGFLTGEYHQTSDRVYAGSTLGWVAFIIQFSR